MEFLKTGVAITVAIAGGACYEPELRDCTLSCTAAADCADGQVCGSDHLCAAPEIAGTCATMPGGAGGTGRDAGVVDAKMPDTRPDAATHVPLAISIAGKGRVTVHGIGTCDASQPQNGSCVLAVPRLVPLTVEATPYREWRFDRWTTAACAVVSINTCTFTPITATPLGAKFKKDHD